MKCPAFNGDWCAYSANAHCWWKRAPSAFSTERCQGARLVPCQPIDAELLFDSIYSEGERKAQVDVMMLVLAKAYPDNPLNPIDRAKCTNIRDLCEYYLTFMKRRVRDADTVRESCSSNSNDVDANMGSQLNGGVPIIKETDGEWV